jgi:hypothetical protein
MTREEMASLASRAFALLMAAWALVEVSSLPERIVSLTHHLAERGVLRTEDYWSTYYKVVLSALVVRILALAIAAVWFWKAGPRTQRLFLRRGQPVQSDAGR